MTNTLETTQPTTLTTPAPDGTTASPTGHRRHGLVLLGLVGGLAVVTATCATVWFVASAPSGPEVPAPVHDDVEVYQPGGSVYSQQVPAGATTGDWQEGYAPGSQTYSEQVPTSAGPGTWTEGYVPGSATYSLQVPSVAR